MVSQVHDPVLCSITWWHAHLDLRRCHAKLSIANFWMEYGERAWMAEALTGLHQYCDMILFIFSLRTIYFFLKSKMSTSCAVLLTPSLRNSPTNHPIQPCIHRHWLSHSDVHTHDCMYTYTLCAVKNKCYSTYISFSKLGFKALHVQSGPCSHSLNHSVKAAKKSYLTKSVLQCCVHTSYSKYEVWFCNAFTLAIVCSTALVNQHFPHEN